MLELFSRTNLNPEAIWPLGIDHRQRSRFHFVLFAIAAGLGFALLSAIGRVLTVNSGDLCTFWLANGFLAAFLSRQPGKTWGAFLLAASVADVLILGWMGRPASMAVAYDFANLTESVLAAIFLYTAANSRRDLASSGMMWRFLGYLVILMPTVCALIGSTYERFVLHIGFLPSFLRWFGDHSLGMATMAPLTLAFYHPGLKKLFSGRRFPHTVGALLLLLAVSLLIFSRPQYPLRMLWLFPFVYIAFQAGIIGAVLGMFEVCLIGALFTLHGHDPLWINLGHVSRDSVLMLQLSLLIMFISVTPFAITVERQRLLRRQLRQGLRRYQLLADNSRDIVVLVNLEGQRLYVSPAVYDVLGWTPEEWTGRFSADLMHPEDVGPFRRLLREMQHGEDRRVFRYRSKHKNGQYIWLEASVRVLAQQDPGDPPAFVANIRDISERMQAEQKLAEAHEQLQQQAQIDSLTQVANRRRFDEVLEREWRRGRRNGRPLALLMVDIDHFKHINDSYGHRAGDQCLRAVGKMLRRIARRSGDLVARYGGEEFAVLLPEVDLTTAMIMADNLCRNIRQEKIEAGVGVTLALTVSVGVAAMIPERSIRADRLVDESDRALYAAKQAGRNRVRPEYVPEFQPGILLPVH